MSPTAMANPEEGLHQFLERLPEEARLAARTLAHAWEGAGGGLVVGRHAVRLTARDGAAAFTAATLHAPRRDATASLEFCRVILQGHGLAEDAWVHWSDELADLRALGFDARARFPTVALDARLGPAELVRLVNALRDLVHALHPDR